MKRLFFTLIILVLVFLIVLGLVRLGTRSGVTDAEVQESLPGDSVIAHPWISIDRAATLPAAEDKAWPWVEQLGKDRAGWYAPMWLENTLKLHSAPTINPAYQNLKVGDVVPDWGGGVLKVISIDPGHSVVYGSLHPEPGIANAARTDYQFTWALVLEESTSRETRFHLRLRMTPPTHGFARYLPPAPLGIIDWATDIVMFAGLQEKLRAS